MTFDEVRQIAFAFPGVEEHLVFGEPTLRVGKRFLACIAKSDQHTLCLKMPDVLLREMLLKTNPDVYYLTDHYATFDSILIRLPRADPDEVRRLIEQTWRHYAPKKVIAAYSKVQG